MTLFHMFGLVALLAWLYKYVVRCKVFGHKWDSPNMLWRECACCGKSGVMKIESLESDGVVYSYEE